MTGLAAHDSATSWRLGLGDELRAALVTPSGCWGPVPAPGRVAVWVHAGRGASHARLAANLGNGCRLSLVPSGREGIATIAPGVVVLRPDHTLAAMTSEAQHLLAGIADYSATSGRLPTAIYSAAACLQSIDRGIAAPECLADGDGTDCQRWLATRSRNPFAWLGGMKTSR